MARQHHYRRFRSFQTKKRTVGALALAVLANTAAVSRSRAQSMPVPVEQQAAVFKRALTYDRTINGVPVVYVVYAEQESDTVELLVNSFRDVGISLATTEVKDLPALGKAMSVVYVAPGTDTAEVESFCANHGVLSISGVPDWAEEGKVSMSLGLSKYDQVKIVVNLNRLRVEGHEFSSNLLKIAEVIR